MNSSTSSLSDWIHRWIIPPQQMILLDSEGELVLQVLNEKKEQENCLPIPKSAKLTQAQRIQYLINCEIEIRNGQTRFTPTQPTSIEFSLGSERITLLQKKEDLIWRLFNEATKTSSSILAINDYRRVGQYFRDLPSDVGAVNTSLLEQISLDISMEAIPREVATIHLRQVPKEMRISYLKNFELAAYRVSDTLPEHLEGVSIQLIKIASRIDRTVEISKDSWAVSLLVQGPSWGHAMIAYEGVAEGEPFLNYCHLVAHLEGCSRPLGSIASCGCSRSLQSAQAAMKNSPAHVEVIQESTVRWSRVKLPPEKKAGPWIVAPEKVKKMVRRVLWEVKQQTENKVPCYFNILGKESSFISVEKGQGINWDVVENQQMLPEGEFVVPDEVKPHNCITWAASKLEMLDIHLNSDKYSWLFTRPNHYIDNPSAIQQVDTRSSIQLKEDPVHPDADSKKIALAQTVRQEMKENPREASEEDEVPYTWEELHAGQYEHEQILKQLKLEVDEAKRNLDAANSSRTKVLTQTLYNRQQLKYKKREKLLDFWLLMMKIKKAFEEGNRELGETLKKKMAIFSAQAQLVLPTSHNREEKKDI